jgi:hypothetical protein
MYMLKLKTTMLDGLQYYSLLWLDADLRPVKTNKKKHAN